MKLETGQNLIFRPTQRLIQTARLLQMSAMELDEYIMAEAQANPAIDFERLEERRLMSPMRAMQRSGQSRADDDDARDALPENGRAASEEASLKEHLLSQLDQRRLDKHTLRVLAFMIDCVDDKGYLSESADCVAELLSIDEDKALGCLELLRSLEPAGICAADMKSCLLLQAQRKGMGDTVAAIIENHLEALSKGRYSSIAAALKVSLPQVHEAARQIRSLDPAPGAAFCRDEQVEYLLPDLVVICEGERARIELCRPYGPYLQLSDFMGRLLRATDDESVRQYIAECMSSAKAFIESIQKREDSLVRCAEALLEIQAACLLRGEAPVPLTMEALAQRLGLTVSTVSRTVKNKYIQCKKGIIPMRSLFGSAADSGDAELSSDGVREMIRELIRNEDRQKPLSDDGIAKLLAQKDIKLSRRAVAKYREQLGIPNTYIRARQDDGK